MSAVFAGAWSLLISGVITATILFFEAQREPKSNRIRRKAKRQIKSSPVAKTIARKFNLSDRTVFDKIQDAYSDQRSNIKTIFGKDPSDLRKMAGNDVLKTLRTLGKTKRKQKNNKSKRIKKSKKRSNKR